MLAFCILLLLPSFLCGPKFKLGFSRSQSDPTTRAEKERFECPALEQQCLESRNVYDIKIIVDMAEYIEKHLDKDGIFRVSGTKEQVERLSSALCAGRDVTWSGVSVHDVTTIFKKLVGSLRKPLVPEELRDVIISEKSVNPDDWEGLESRILGEISKMPRAEMELLVYCFRLLQHVSLHEEQNRMSPKNLAVVFAPRVLEGRISDDPLIQDEYVSLLEKENEAIQTLIKVGYEDFTDIPIPGRLQQRGGRRGAVYWDD